MKKIPILACLAALFLASCGCGKNNKVDTSCVADLCLEHYAGTWYEIAREPNSFEKGLTHIRAEYQLMDNGRVKVINSGLRPDGKRKFTHAEAYAPQDEKAATLRVSFVPPYRWFYGDYRVLYISPDYQTALVSSDGPCYLWLLSRKTKLSELERETLLQEAKKRGFETNTLIWVNHD